VGRTTLCGKDQELLHAASYHLKWQNKPPASAKKLISKLNILADSYITEAASTNFLPQRNFVLPQRS